MKSINDIILEKLIKIKNITLLVVFWSEWCSPCRIMKNVVGDIKILFKKKTENNKNKC